MRRDLVGEVETDAVHATDARCCGCDDRYARRRGAVSGTSESVAAARCADGWEYRGSASGCRSPWESDMCMCEDRAGDTALQNRRPETHALGLSSMRSSTRVGRVPEQEAFR
eukprot:3247876-Pleurochrysis_carterae.AAC.1